MDEDDLSALSQSVHDEVFLYWVSDQLSHWVASGLIPEELLAPCRVLDLYDYLLKNRHTLLKNLRKH